MRIKVDYIAQAKKISGVESEVVTVKDTTGVKDLLAVMAQMHGAELTALLFDEGDSLQGSILVSVNDEQVFPAENGVLFDGDVVTVMTPMSGG